MTKQAVTETIRICKNRNIVKEYLSSKEVEVVTIMMSLFDEEQIMKTFIKDERRDEARETTKRNAIIMLKKGEFQLKKYLLFP